MPVALAKMYETLTEQQQEKTYNFIFALYQENTKTESSTKKIDDAFGMWKDRTDMEFVNLRTALNLARNSQKTGVPEKWSRADFHDNRGM